MPSKSRLASLRTEESAAHARNLRRGMTNAERRLWYHLRAGRFQGWKVRRQVPLGPYVADFLCEKARVIVEVDGGQHAERISHDLARTQWLESRGYRVFRYWNNDVMGNIEGVLVNLGAVLLEGRDRKV